MKTISRGLSFLHFTHLENIWLIRDYWCLQIRSIYVMAHFMFANTPLRITSQCHDVKSTLVQLMDQFCTMCVNLW